MALGATRKVLEELARLDQAAERAGCALVCMHQSADEFHGALIRDYLSLHRPRHPFAYAAAVTMLLAAFLVMI